MKLCLIRHGETDWNKAGRLQGREDIPLNAAGIAQAKQLARYLADESWQAVIASPLCRASRTAQIVADALGIAEHIIDDCLMERDYGAGSGLTLAERSAKYPDGEYDGMEDWEAMRGRVFGGVRAYAERFAGQNIIIVSHGSALNSVLCTLSGGTIGSGKTRLQNASVNMLEYTDGKFTIAFYNQSAEELLRA